MTHEKYMDLTPLEEAKLEAAIGLYKTWELPMEEQMQVLEYLQKTIQIKLDAFHLQATANLEIVEKKPLSPEDK